MTAPKIHEAEVAFESVSKSLDADEENIIRQSQSWISEIQFCVDMVRSNRIDDVLIRLLLTISIAELDIALRALALAGYALLVCIEVLRSRHENKLCCVIVGVV